MSDRVLASLDRRSPFYEAYLKELCELLMTINLVRDHDMRVVPRSSDADENYDNLVLTERAATYTRTWETAQNAARDFTLGWNKAADEAAHAHAEQLRPFIPRLEALLTTWESMSDCPAGDDLLRTIRLLDAATRDLPDDPSAGIVWSHDLREKLDEAYERASRVLPEDVHSGVVVHLTGTANSSLPDRWVVDDTDGNDLLLESGDFVARFTCTRDDEWPCDLLLSFVTKAWTAIEDPSIGRRFRFTGWVGPHAKLDERRLMLTWTECDI